MRAASATVARSAARRRSATEQYARAKDLESLSILMLADAEDEDEEDAAFLFICLVLEEKMLLRRRCRGRFGHRGPYNQKKSIDFFDPLLHGFSERWFKSWMRYACTF